jgi:predicted dienelactone hydrolase
MNGFFRGLQLVALSGIVLALSLAGCGGGGGGADDNGGGGGDDSNAPSAVVQPLTLPGPYAVACSNIAQNFSGLSGDDAKTYWEGTGHYVTALLTDPTNTLIATVTAPSDSDLYGSFIDQEFDFVVIACYPTTADNPRLDYPLPTGDVVPHMQTGSEAPLFADDSARYPVVVFSNGFGDSPIHSEDYISALSILASYGYVVIAPFHGDFRFVNIDINNLGDFIDAASNLEDFTAMQALRPLSISAALTLVLEHPQWQDHLDATQIGGFGVSMGGETMMLLGGAGLTTSYLDIGASWKQVTHDTRIKAAVGYVPYFGQSVLPAFGHDQDGIEGTNLPFLGISGTADTVAPINETNIGMSRLSGHRRLVALSGVTHGFDVASKNDIYTWTLTFLDAEVRGDPVAISRLSTMGSVAGGGDDSVWLY